MSTAMLLTADGHAPRELSQDDVGIVPLFTHLPVRNNPRTKELFMRARGARESRG